MRCVDRVRSLLHNARHTPPQRTPTTSRRWRDILDDLHGPSTSDALPFPSGGLQAAFLRPTQRATSRRFWQRQLLEPCVPSSGNDLRTRLRRALLKSTRLKGRYDLNNLSTSDAFCASAPKRVAESATRCTDKPLDRPKPPQDHSNISSKLFHSDAAAKWYNQCCCALGDGARHQSQVAQASALLETRALAPEYKKNTGRPHPSKSACG